VTRIYEMFNETQLVYYSKGTTVLSHVKATGVWI